MSASGPRTGARERSPARDADDVATSRRLARACATNIRVDGGRHFSLSLERLAFGTTANAMRRMPPSFSASKTSMTRP